MRLSPPARAALVLAALVTVPAGHAPAAAQEIPFLEHSRVDPAKIVSAEACGECHAAAFEVWKNTPHATGFKTLHRKDSAQAIARKLDFRLIKRQSFCFSCHYTPVLDDDSLRVISGVSCESCHGAARDWIDVHNKYGEGFDYRTEPAAHRAERIARSVAGGMRRPSDLYPVAANCYGCHTVPNERLVNVGGHSTGSSDFELVAWSQGEIRHNFLDSFRAGGGRENAERPMERKRMMYVVGRALDLEYSLRGVAEASEPGVYAKAMTRRVRIAVSELRAVAESAPLPEVDRMLAAVREARVAPGNREALLRAAESVGAATRSFLDGHDGTALASLDDLVLGRDTAPVEEPFQVAAGGDAADAGPAAEDPGRAGPAGGLGAAPSVPAGGEPGAAPAGTPSAAAPASRPAPGVVGEFKRRIRPASRHATRGPGACSGCHGPQNGWWYADPHFATADPFFERAADNARIARLYGVDPGRMARGDAVCMDCHGTVVTGREGREVQDGVGCEECHGPAGDWLEPHKDETDKHLGRRRPGYLAALPLGKRPLHEMDERARVCVGCHYVIEPRLISAGHPSGAGFDYVAGMEKTRHWQAPVAAEEIRRAFDAVLAARGAVPDVRIAALPAAGTGGPGGGGNAAVPAGASPIRATAPRPRPAGAAGKPSAAGPETPILGVGPSTGAGSFAAPAHEADEELALPAFPELDETSSVEEVLAALQQRLERLYAEVSEREVSAGGTP